MDWAVNEFSVSGYPVIIVFDTIHSIEVVTINAADAATGVITSINTQPGSAAWANIDMTSNFNAMVADAPDNANGRT